MSNFLGALGRKAKEAHCWHSDGIVLTSNPPQHPETCCNCGAKRIRTSRFVPVTGHGPHVKSVGSYETVTRGGDGPCVSTKDNPTYDHGGF